MTTLPVWSAGSILPEITTSVLQPKKGEIIVNNDPEIIKIRKRIAAILPIFFNWTPHVFGYCVSISFNNVTLKGYVQENNLRLCGLSSVSREFW